MMQHHAPSLSWRVFVLSFVIFRFRCSRNGRRRGFYGYHDHGVKRWKTLSEEHSRNESLIRLVGLLHYHLTQYGRNRLNSHGARNARNAALR